MDNLDTALVPVIILFAHACNYCIIAEYKIDSIETEIIQNILANIKKYAMSKLYNIHTFCVKII